MKIHHTNFNDLFFFEAEKYTDDRGSFLKLYCQEKLGSFINERLSQINLSNTKKKGTIRGLHMQQYPMQEYKIIRCIKGSVFDVAVDLRKDSKTFMKYFSIELNEKNNISLVIPPGFAHGFQSLENDTLLLYFHSKPYSKDHELGFRFDDQRIDISWPLELGVISKRDQSFEKISPNFEGL